MSKIYQTLLIASFLLITVLSSVRPPPVSIPQISAVYGKQWYSGYLDIGNSHMHYFFFPSQHNSSTDPLLFWFNGGPGCSSLLGALYEHGPFLANDAFGFISYNPYSWNQKANVVYIQSPSEVGFSYMDNKQKDFTWTDQIVAQLNRDAVLEFYKVWPQFKRTQTYIAGQSYAGIYVPTLVNEIHEHNKFLAETQQVNLQGFAIGNGCTHSSQCEFLSDYPPYLMRLYRDLGFISQQMFDNLQNLCANKGQQLPDDCVAALDEALKMQNGVNIYDAFRPCYQNQVNSTIKKSFKQIKRLALRKRQKEGDRLSWAPPCVDAVGIDGLLNNAQNRKAMGIPDKVQNYSMCNDNEDFYYDRSTTGSYWVYQKLIPLNKYRIMIYSGDSDPAVPTSGTFFWVDKIVNELKLGTMQYWKPWFTQTTDGPQNGGNVWQFTKLFKLVTFKGIGHMAPQWNVKGGQKMIYNLLYGDEL